jgi:hypothetical protein
MIAGSALVFKRLQPRAARIMIGRGIENPLIIDGCQALAGGVEQVE